MPDRYVEYAKFQELLENDGEYISITEDFREAEAEYLKFYRQLSPDQQQTLTEYIGKLSELHLRQLELLISLAEAVSEAD
jgi:hypothetical protein